MSPTDKLERLCKGVRTIGSGFEIHFKPSEDSPDEWAVMVIAGEAAILINTDFAPLDDALSQACSRLASISQRTLVAVRPSSPPPAETERTPPEKSTDKK